MLERGEVWKCFRRQLLRRGPGKTVVFLRTTEAEMGEPMVASAKRQGIGAAHVCGCSAKIATSAAHRSRKGCLRRARRLQTFGANVSHVLHPLHKAANVILCLSLMALFAKHGVFQRPNDRAEARRAKRDQQGFGCILRFMGVS